MENNPNNINKGYAYLQKLGINIDYHDHYNALIFSNFIPPELLIDDEVVFPCGKGIYIVEDKGFKIIYVLTGDENISLLEATVLFSKFDVDKWIYLGSCSSISKDILLGDIVTPDCYIKTALSYFTMTQSNPSFYRKIEVSGDISIPLNANVRHVKVFRSRDFVTETILHDSIKEIGCEVVDKESVHFLEVAEGLRKPNKILLVVNEYGFKTAPSVPILLKEEAVEMAVNVGIPDLLDNLLEIEHDCRQRI